MLDADTQRVCIKFINIINVERKNLYMLSIRKEKKYRKKLFEQVDVLCGHENIAKFFCAVKKICCF